ncbi:MAG TPA: OmpA family protein, partial [Terriglobales bacterium]
EQEREQMRARLLQQLNQVLQTRDTARGLIVNMSDVLFDFGKATLRPGARLRLAKVAGIIQAYPDLKLQVEGHTDAIGSDQFNQELSERRAAAVRDFLVQEGVPINNVSAQGYGKKDPVASNTTAEGRQMNRRVDLVVSGAAIGQATTPEGPVTSNPRSMAAPANNAPANNTSPQLQPVPPANDNTPR